MNLNIERALGSTLYDYRKRQGLSQEALAEKAGLDRSYISILERGLKSPTLATLERVCEKLGVLPEEVIREARARLKPGKGGR